MLLSEGQTMKNCVASYIHSVAAGKVFVYRVVAPGRATLAVVPGRRSGRWRISELKGHCNTEVSSATVRAVLSWLKEAQGQRKLSGRELDNGR